MHPDIYTGSDQKTLRQVVNLLNKEINSITIIIRLQQIIKEYTTLLNNHKRWTKVPPESHRGWPTFLATTQHSIF